MTQNTKNFTLKHMNVWQKPPQYCNYPSLRLSFLSHLLLIAPFFSFLVSLAIASWWGGTNRTRRHWVGVYKKRLVHQFSRSVMSDPLWPHELQHARPPCPSPTPRVHSNSRPWSWWCYPAISSSVIPFSSCPQSLPASESFLVSQLFAWGGQSTGVSALASLACP